MYIIGLPRKKNLKSEIRSERIKIIEYKNATPKRTFYLGDKIRNHFIFPYNPYFSLAFSYFIFFFLISDLLQISQYFGNPIKNKY